jgi:AAA15 family ATPase/GTPase
MEDNHLKSFEVSGFKKFDNLKLEDLGQFNLIIGDNNVGKTSLLEVLCATQNLETFCKSLANISLHVRRNQNLNRSFLHQYFSNENEGTTQTILIKENSKEEYSIKLTRRNEYDVKGFSIKDSLQYLVNSDDIGESLSFDYNRIDKNSFDLSVPFIPFGALYQHELTSEYSKYIQQSVKKKERFISALSNILKGIKNIEVNSSLSSSPVLFIAESGKDALSPLSNYGDGTVKLFRILLSLFGSNSDYSRLMIDEIDTGVHYSHLKSFISSLLQVAKEEKKQIFATTHSKECIENFTKALEEAGMQDEGRIIHLADTKNGIKAFTMRYAEFENSIMAESEIR